MLYVQYTLLKVLNSTILIVFKEISSRLRLFNLKYSKNVNIFKYFLFFLNIF